MEEGSLLRPATLQVPENLPELPGETMVEAHATAIAWLKVRTATTQDLRKAVSDIERFTGEVGELNHFLKSADRVLTRIEAKKAEDLVDAHDAESLRADLICRIKRSILNLIQADEETPWEVVKERLKKAYGGGRWTPEEDLFQLFRVSRNPRQSNGSYARELLIKFNKVTDKMRETVSAPEVEARMAFVATILKVQLARETGKKDNFPGDKGFLECAQEMMDVSAREEESRPEPEERSWSEVVYRRPRGSPQRTRGAVREPRRTDRRDQRPTEHRDQGPRKPVKANRREERRCHGCGKPGHLVAQCSRTKCFECGDAGHIARQCPYMFRRREHPRGEPMEINRVWRRQRPRPESPRTSGTSEGSDTEREDPGPGSSGDEGTGVRERSGRRRAAQPGRSAA